MDNGEADSTWELRLETRYELVTLTPHSSPHFLAHSFDIDKPLQAGRRCLRCFTPTYRFCNKVNHVGLPGSTKASSIRRNKVVGGCGQPGVCTLRSRTGEGKPPIELFGRDVVKLNDTVCYSRQHIVRVSNNKISYLIQVSNLHPQVRGFLCRVLLLDWWLLDRLKRLSDSTKLKTSILLDAVHK